MLTQLSLEFNASEKAIDRIRSQSNQYRSKYIVDAIKQNPKAYTGRFRKMASSPFYFYRGSALLFYQDLKDDIDAWINTNKAAGNIFIHGDLHAENFGTYLNSHGILNFDVNDFDEGYCGPFALTLKNDLIKHE